ncbi:spermidine coumaroyl-coa acyltransferase [Quercus suber]|uniref:Spermidine coumaroyl-coa acyltransferase n=1 Tax=Quercus suber TaxID=58331 RepID=A0AAW0LMS6_QUESU
MLVKPSKPTSSGLFSLSSIDKDPHLEIFCQTVNVYRLNVDSSYYDNHNCTSSFDGQVGIAYVIKEAFSKVLVFYHPLAGKLEKHSDGKLHINCNEDGVPFLVAATNFQLFSLNYLDGVDGEVTKFSCGGCTIGMGLSHSICDGFGAAQFFRALVELASEKSELLVKPVWERERLVATPTKKPFQLMFLDGPSLATSPYMSIIDLLHECFHSFKIELKWENQFLVSYVIWKLLNPPLPDRYYGNAFVSQALELIGGELNELPLSKVAKLIKESKKGASTTDYIMTSLRMLERFRQLDIKFKDDVAIMVLIDWRQLGFLENVDFGRIESVNMITLPWNMIGYVDMCVLLPPTSKVDASMKGGVRLFLSLPSAAMAKFKEEMDTLKLL